MNFQHFSLLLGCVCSSIAVQRSEEGHIKLRQPVSLRGMEIMGLFFVSLSQGLNTRVTPSVLTSNCVNKKVLHVSFRPSARNLHDCVKLNRTILFYIGLHLNYTGRLSWQLFSIRLS